MIKDVQFLVKTEAGKSGAFNIASIMLIFHLLDCKSDKTIMNFIRFFSRFHEEWFFFLIGGSFRKSAWLHASCNSKLNKHSNRHKVVFGFISA